MKLRKAIAATVMVSALSGCNTMSSSQSLAVSPSHSHQPLGTQSLSDVSDLVTNKNLIQQLVAKSFEAIESGDLLEASSLLNTALRFDISNAHLQFLNAYTYHLMGVSGDASNFTLAEQGYKLASKFDNSSAIAKYYLGLLYLDQRRYSDAQTELATAALMYDDDPEVLYDLAYASYYAGDPRTADAALAKITSQHPTLATSSDILRARMISKAALDDQTAARRMLDEYRENNQSAHDLPRLDKRLGAWSRFHDSFNSGGMMRTALPTGPAVIPGANVAKANNPTSEQLDNNATDFVDDKMVVVDVVIIRTQEDVTTTKGMNLLSGLELQFGDPLNLTPGWSKQQTRLYGSGTTDSVTNTISKEISIPAVNYSLNIFNTMTGSNEILARPSLVALSGERSEFFSGVDVVAAAVSGGDGSSISINKQIGVKLSVVPEFLPGNRVQLEVEAERTFLTTPSSSVVFEFRLDTSKTTVNANVAMKFGETLVLSGLSEKDVEATRDQVPFLGDIPALQYLFSREAKRDYRKSVVILLTPRRAHYVNQSQEDRELALSNLNEFERSIYAFEQRNQSWFTPRSNITETLAMAQNNALFMEYRAGDFKLEKWSSRKTNGDRIKEAAEFLFY